MRWPWPPRRCGSRRHGGGRHVDSLRPLLSAAWPFLGRRLWRRRFPSGCTAAQPALGLCFRCRAVLQRPLATRARNWHHGRRAGQMGSGAPRCPWAQPHWSTRPTGGGGPGHLRYWAAPRPSTIIVAATRPWRDWGGVWEMATSPLNNPLRLVTRRVLQLRGFERLVCSVLRHAGDDGHRAGRLGYLRTYFLLSNITVIII